MKREAIGHTKMKRLCRRLDIPLYQGVGLMETIWHLAAREAPRGKIGKLSDEDIALALDYRGDEAKLIEALVASGWLDRDAGERLVIHDWYEHADDAIQMRLARARLYFVGGRAPKLSRMTGKEREAAHEYYVSAIPCAQNSESCTLPEPLPEPEPFFSAAEIETEQPRQIRSERKVMLKGISPAIWEDFKNRYTESGKALNEMDWNKAGMEAVTLDLTDADMTERVIPALVAELPGWANREIGMVPFPGNWLKTQSWTRKGKPRPAPLTREQRRQAEIDKSWDFSDIKSPLEVSDASRN